MAVTYRGKESDRFDREYYSAQHLPLVKKAWGRYGMETISAFFPHENANGAGQGTGIVAA